ncbi:DUF192 domain-containing protein [Sphingomonas lacunae]|uniref:DUF192 domain-containing protein n=1 Tax=Sphingomonas lacunae TaxID=2698828 RepID=A0A6M4ASV4_9SPHN|nr:DUF192 domain-containing protein [Sphingomonas lacunae]QJQ31149.1 DUF192 domain-containing protein [Sphingomonas lacunae]
MTSASRFFALLLAGAALGLGGCSGAGADGPVAESGLRLVPLTIQQGSQTHRFTVEVAATTAEQQRGLMMRTSLAPDRGMIFPFDPPKAASFWMKDTLIPLDLLFIRADGSIDRIAENTPPESLEPIVSGGEVAAVLELAGGSAARLGLDESAIVRWEKP